jgi:hypothetical protein
MKDQVTLVIPYFPHDKFKVGSSWIRWYLYLQRISCQIWLRHKLEVTCELYWSP